MILGACAVRICLGVAERVVDIEEDLPKFRGAVAKNLVKYAWGF